MPADGALVDVQELWKRWASGDRDLSKLSDVEIEGILQAERQGGAFPGELGIEPQMDRERGLESPSFLATEIVDPYYKRNFEPIHYRAMDEVFAPYLLGETVRIDGANYEPDDFLGILVLWSRFTYKSSMAWLMLLWCYLYWKIRLGRDARAMYVHQVIKKAIQRGENIRNTAKGNQRFRAAYPEFAAKKGEWDTKEEWAWENFVATAAGEMSFKAYGETSDKTGGHYTPRFVDDWETEHLKSETSREDNYQSFLGLDPLIDDTEGFCPLVISGTTYFFTGTHERLIRDGGYLVWKVPAHKGSAKVLFDLATLDPRDAKQKAKIERGLKRLETERADDLNFPKRLPWRKLYKRCRGQGRLVYPGQMLLNPTPEGENRFDFEAIDDTWCDVYPGPEEMWIYIRCDPAISKKKSACDTAYVVGGVRWDGYRFFIDGWAGRETQPNKIVLKGFELARKWQERNYIVKSIGWESVAYQKALKEIAIYGVPEREAKYDGEEIPVVMRPCSCIGLPRESDTSQEERILSMDGPLSRRQIKIYKRNPIGEKMADQMRMFPNGPRDLIDAAQGLWVRTAKPPKPIDVQAPRVPAQVLEMMRRARQDRSERPTLCGTSGNVRLQSW